MFCFSHNSYEILTFEVVLKPLVSLLSSCSKGEPLEVEKRLVILLNQLSVSLAQNTALVSLFFSPELNFGKQNR